MTSDELEERLRAGGYSEDVIRGALARLEENQARQRRWVEQWDHWKNVDAFSASIERVRADRVVDEAEHRDQCFKVEQWSAQLTAAREYVQEYRVVEPEVVQQNPGLGNLERQAERGLVVVRSLEATC